MKRITVTAFITAITLATLTYAAENQPSDKKPPATKAGPMQPGGMAMMDDKQMAQMQENMKRMQQQMDKMRATTDRLVSAHGVGLSSRSMAWCTGPTSGQRRLCPSEKG
jgi:uncharacterized protein involved in copper resistance